MQPDWNELGPDGLAFFGRMCASVSHELKNSLAMINENAGLIGDILMLAERGKPLDAAMLAKASERIGKHVGRADGIIGNLNRFAHLADHPVNAVELEGSVALAVALHQRLASQREVELVLQPCGVPVELRTRPFLLANALHACLDRAIEAARGGVLRIRVAEAPQGATISFIGEGADVAAPDGMAHELFSALGARIECAGGELELTVADLANLNQDK